MHGRTAQVKVAVAQAQVVIDIDLVAQLKRGGLGLAQDAQFSNIQLHIAGGDLVGLGGALTQLAAADNNIFALEALGLGKDLLRRVLIEHQLQDAGGIAQVGKDDAALVAGTGDRAADRHFLTSHCKADFTAVVGAAQAAQSFHISSPLYGYSFLNKYYTAPRRVWQVACGKDGQIPAKSFANHIDNLQRDCYNIKAVIRTA